MLYTSYGELKQEHEKKFDAVLKSSGMFFAFSKEQFDNSKTDLEPGDKYVHTYAGGYMPKSMVPKWEKDTEELQSWLMKTIDDCNLKESHIIYELRNHEAFYSYDISGAMSALPFYTEFEVQAVFNKYAPTEED